MADIQPGDYVFALESGSGWTFREPVSRIWFEEGNELRVTSIARDGRLNVSLAAGSRVFRIPAEKVRVEGRRVGEIPAGGIPADDVRIEWFFEDAERLATRLGFCEEYERIANLLGVPGRERTWHITLVNGDGVKVTAALVARSRKLAEERLRAAFRSTPPLALTGGDDQ